MDCTIAQATQTEIKQVVKLFDEYRQFYHQPSDLNSAHEFIQQRITDNSSVIFLASDSNGMGLGFVQLYPSFSSVKMKPIYILNDLYVSQHARCVGVGGKLIERCIAFAQDQGVNRLVLATHQENMLAQKLYRNYGFVQEQEFLSFHLVV
ncbi:GNAT family N-acetyltransferase [Parashewanella curva]|uniref:GNAT family N-acetyltransferase n=1 Tax=Parashewanella curva TaxID=2338552 RepID=A0A3L8PSU0_9GAMM|nr:GNAT family N-acetyltransferase [Parashewanella curva]RLV58461.1 GNAT family N-acetyltransferase [Parashewanella curva]